MAKLSPAAQATYDAFNRVGIYNEPTFETDRKALAAALRAAADQVVPEQQEPGNDAKWRAFVRYEERNSLRIKLLSIAAELEEQ